MSRALSRRKLFEAGSGALAGAALAATASGAHAEADQASRNEKTIRAWYQLWADSRDWAPFGDMLAEDFVFSSPNGDDHISKAKFKTRCWDSNINLTKGFDLEAVMAKDDSVFVKYLGHTTGGNTFQNVELLRLRDGRITSIECYFGGKASFPAAVDSHTKG